MVLVKFVAIGNKNNISEYYNYVENIFNELSEQGYADDYQIDIEDDYPTVFFGKVDKDNLEFKIIFEFETYRNVLQLTIDITSDCYQVSLDDVYLEKLKFFVKKLIIKDWNKIIWLYDDDAYILSKDLYRKLYVTENSIRRFINEFMIKTFGPEWWELLSDQSIKDKYKARFKGYKTVVPGFNNVDDHLLSIDVKDLLKILTMKILEWNPIYDANIEKLLVASITGNECKIVERMKKQLAVKEDFWEKYFKKYFDDNFVQRFDEFVVNRNHIAHNKLLDRSAYKGISRSIDRMDEYMQSALSMLYKDKKSIEQMQMEAREYEELLLDAKQNDTGIVIRKQDSIIEEFGSILEEKYLDIIEALRFREDIKITDLMFDVNEYSGNLFSAFSKVTKKQIDFNYSLDINDDEGAESTLIITCEQSPFIIKRFENEQGFIVTIIYINGAVEYDDELGCYAPFINDGISESDIDNYVSTIVDFINTELESLKDYVESIRYEVIKKGENMPIALGVYCDECLEEYICIDEKLAKAGTCLNCGTFNDIVRCERCGQHFIDYVGDDIKLCDNCKEHFEME